MKNSYLLLGLVVSLLVLTMTACSSSDEGNKQDSKDVSIEYVSMEDLPDWIAQWALNMDEAVGSNVCFRNIEGYHGSELYRGEWEGVVYYWIINPLSSCVFCDSFYEDGKRLDFEDERVKQAFESAYKNRKRIYIK